jgi:hypothetical protein
MLGRIKGDLEPTSIFKIQKLNENLMILKMYIIGRWMENSIQLQHGNTNEKHVLV